MFDIGWSELLVIAVVAIVVVGPKDLPKLMRGFGHYAGKFRRAAGDFQRQFEEAMRESEVDEVRKAIESARTAPVALDQPVMLPKPVATAAPAKPVAKPIAKPARKRGAAKTKSPSKVKSPAKRKPKTERAT